jgi:hypothetical protein
MEKIIKALSLIAIACIMVGCAYESPIERYSESRSYFRKPTPLMSHNVPDKDIYRVFVQGATGYVPVSSCRSYAEERAEQFCSRLGKGMMVLGQQQSNPIPYPFNFPKVEIVFAAIDKPQR